MGGEDGELDDIVLSKHELQKYDDCDTQSVEQGSGIDIGCWILDLFLIACFIL